MFKKKGNLFLIALQKMIHILRFGVNSSISMEAKVSLNAMIKQPLKVIIGIKSRINVGVVIQPNNMQINIGKFVDINQYAVLYGRIKIGDFCMIAPGVMLAGGGHSYSDTSTPMRMQGVVNKGGIIIEDDVWIGANAVILDGVKIGKGAIVGAGAVVTKSIEPYSINAGNPARRIGSRK